MKNVDHILKTRSTLMLFFAFLSGLSTVATAVLPGVVHA